MSIYLYGGSGVSKGFEPIKRWDLPYGCPHFHIRCVGSGSDEANARAEHDMVRAYIIDHINEIKDPGQLYRWYWEAHWEKWGVAYRPIPEDPRGNAA